MTGIDGRRYVSDLTEEMAKAKVAASARDGIFWRPLPIFVVAHLDGTL